jgi:pimeloyl-ACP methyl ester carboxylesterase
MGTGASAPRPTLWQSLSESRALLEVISLAPARPLLKLAPGGDGHPVLVLPGFFASDGSTATLRRFLARKQFDARPWGEGRNPGISDALFHRLEGRLKQLALEHGGKVSLVGWSLGGIYARLLAHRWPGLVRQVVTLGSPFSMGEYGSVNGAVERLYQRINPEQTTDPMLDHAEIWRTAPPVPSTSIFSRGDGIAHWSYCMDKEDEQTENLVLPGSHLGMTHNPLYLYCIAERLSQPEGAWKPFGLASHLLDLLERGRS